MKIFESVRECPFCSQMGEEKYSIVTLFGEEVDEFMKHLLYGEPIQKAMPNTHPALREFLRVTNNPRLEGYCGKHMEMMFGKTSPRIKDFAPAMKVGDFFDLDGEDNIIESREQYEQLQNELTDLDKLLAQSEWSGCERYVRVDFVERVPEGVDVICKTEHLALYFPSGQEED